MTSGLLLTHKTNIIMTREAFIRKWCCTGYGYTEEKRDEMRDDLDSVIDWANSFNQNNNLLDIANVSIAKCDVCGCHPSVIIRTEFGTFCQAHARYVR